jgi:opacity protein-like surface antigen
MDMSSWTEMRWARIAVGATWLSVLALAAPRFAAAQSTDGSTQDAGSASGLEFVGYVGLLTPLSKLADSGDTLSAEFSTKVAVAAELDYWFGSFGIGLQGSFSDPKLTLQIVENEGFPTSVPLGDADLWRTAVNFMWRPTLGGSAVVARPYFGAGPGVVWVMYPENEDFTIEDETRFAISLVGGAQVEVRSGWFVRLDVRDYISKLDTEPFADTKTQNDLTITFGIGYSFH